MGDVMKLAGGGVADLAWHGTERRRTPRGAPPPEEYGVAVLSPGEFAELVDEARRQPEAGREWPSHRSRG
jgi:hypothetical protein